MTNSSIQVLRYYLIDAVQIEKHGKLNYERVIYCCLNIYDLVSLELVLINLWCDSFAAK